MFEQEAIFEMEDKAGETREEPDKTGKKKKSTVEIPSDRPLTADERTAIMAEINKKKTLVNIGYGIKITWEKLAANGDSGMGLLSYAGFVIAYTMQQDGRHLEAAFVAVVTVALIYAKHKLPDGPITGWLRSSEKSKLDGVKKTIDQVRKTFK
jgi:hypothetical protein